MTEFNDGTSDAILVEQNNGAHDQYKLDEMDGCTESTNSDDLSRKSDSSTSSCGSWSIDDSIEFMQTSHKPLFDELPTFSLQSASRSISPLINEPISLFNLSISPISSIEDLSHINDQSVNNSNYLINGKYIKDLTEASDAIESVYDEDERISLEEITAQINTPPSLLSRSNKRLNLETIFEDVFLETPKKRRFNCFKKFNSWRIETQQITNEERISSYVIEQQQNRDNQSAPPDTTNLLCNSFDDKINII